MHTPTVLRRITLVAIATVVVGTFASPAHGETRLRNICRLKGQEENVLRGLGLVVGLNGTGEANDLPTMQAIARAMELLGSPVGSNGLIDPTAVDELKKIKNASLVLVTASVPATGARRGEKLDCTVSAWTGKSLVGGQLAFAALQGPNLRDRQVYALCSGSVNVEDSEVPTVGRVHNGCQMEQDIYTPFYLERDGVKWITLVLDSHHASFHTAADVAGTIASNYTGYYSPDALRVEARPDDEENFVRAIDATNIEVRIPDSYEANPVSFAYEILELTISEEDPEARVVINNRTKTVVISGDVRIGDVVVVTDQVVIEAGLAADFTALDDSESANPSLERLVQQLNTLKVSRQEVIDIIQRINKAGKLHGKLIVE